VQLLQLATRVFLRSSCRRHDWWPAASGGIDNRMARASTEMPREMMPEITRDEMSMMTPLYGITQAIERHHNLI
jgi:hypothetical protein